MSELMLPVASIFQNRLNANEMEIVKFGQLKLDIKAEDYDAITVSPVDVFYDAEARMDPRVTEFIPADADVTDLYIICDGFHRHKGASQLGLIHIRAVIKHMTESDAMAHFYRRHKIHGEMNPILEAEMFRQEIETRGITIAKLAEIYNLTSASYVKTRLALLNVTMDVVDLFYMPPADFPGKLTTEHLKSISYLPKNMQFSVAMMSLERNWRIEDIRIECNRIREGKGLRPVGAFKKVTTTRWVPTEGVEGPPSSNPTLIQRHLHPNIDRLLNPSEERVVRAVKKRGEARNKELAEDLGLGVSTMSIILKQLVEMDVLDFREERKEGQTGRATRIYRLWVAEEQAKSEYVRDKALTDEELLEQYPEVYKKTITKKTVTVKEKAREKKKPQRVTVGEPRPEPIAPDAWKDTFVEQSMQPLGREQPRRSRREPPLILNQELIEDFGEAVYTDAISEGFNIKTKTPIEGREPGLWLENEIRLELEEWIMLREAGKRDFRNLVAIGKRVCQLYTRHREI
ncbi:hypothetical protein LCGC14_1616900 [marine sediment metagenome]|uniref:ParB/Sulfiredoxin domain-containing protein n=1 Tax=marine sediment metagenome TaxID=412755 RepID=A0A0F9L6K2_9ZZZZ